MTLETIKIFKAIVNGLCILGMVTSACWIIKCKLEMRKLERDHRDYLMRCIDGTDTIMELNWMDKHLTDCGY